jgi:Zn-finger protein
VIRVKRVVKRYRKRAQRTEELLTLAQELFDTRDCDYDPVHFQSQM